MIRKGRSSVLMKAPDNGWRRFSRSVDDRAPNQNRFCTKHEHIVGLYPQAEVIRVVLDNLNTHKIGSLYDAFPSEQAHRISRPLEFHPPKHGSGLNIAEIEWAVLANRRPERMLYETSLRQHVQANIKERNAKA